MISAVKNGHDNARKHERKPYSRVIDYSLSISENNKRKWLNLKGQAVDISEAGLGLHTDHPLEPGHIVWFNGGLEEKAGYVRWCTNIAGDYRAGIELDEKYVRRLDDATDIFNRRLEEIEKRCQKPEESPDVILGSIQQAIDEILSVCGDFEREVRDINIIRDARIRFRTKTDHLLSRSYLINRARTWPLGYQGDFKMLESFYRDTPLSEGFGYYLDLVSLNAALALAVKNRMRKLKGILREELSVRHKPSVLNIACGSCREVFELAHDIEQSVAKFTCIDLDNGALSFAANRLSYTNISPVSSNQVSLRKYNALRMFDHELNMDNFGKQDIIYSVGFFDYLPSDFLATLFNALYDLLNPGGILITSFKDANRYRHQDYHWIGDWDGFLQRTEEDFRSIFSDAHIPFSEIKESREESGVIVFYLATKKSNEN
jgi:SAM-dependent methyltransferase